ncbi:uncharacterized protein LOC109856804, partial [Pseudomyrmex gracilis]|uniref:uncharacterized protein LOC109856804 n=1 Tax=Pseudomyrmex gracilis TaxID=219809 RepID=UPI0009954091
MLVPPVAQSGTGDRPVGDTVARAQQTTGPATTTLWPLAPAQPNQVPNQQSQGIPPLAATPAPAHNQGANRYGLYSLFPGGGGGSYVAATPATPGQPTAARAYHATTHKVSESVFSAAVGVGVGGYTWGAPTPPPGSPYSPVPVTQLELLAKNLANLAPAAAAGQQALSLQGVGVNVAGSLHHAQHTQHTQHTLNLTGLHHLHHGGLHQNAFSPQLSLVTGSTPTLTINNFSSPNSNGVVPTTGVLLQEYQSPIGVTASATGCAVTMNGSSCLTNTSSATGNVVVHGGGGNQATANQTTVQPTATTKKREAFLPSQGQPVKLENKSTRTSCLCRNSNGKTKVVHSDVGCSRTLPVVSSWNGQDINTGSNNSNAGLTVKREPLASVPCQVAEVSTSLHATATSVKIEPVPPKSENGIVVSNAAAGGIPVGIAVARQRLQHQETSTSMRNVSLSHHTSHHATSYHHFQPDGLGTNATAMAVGGTTLVHCGGPGGEDRAAHLAAISSGALAPSLSLNSTLNSSLNSTLGSIGGAPAAAGDTTAATWPPTLWQYPAATAAAMPTDPVGFPQVNSGLQGGFHVVRDPTTGHILLIHAAEQMQQAVVWPNYPNHNGNVAAPPPFLLPPPPPSIQVLGDIGGARLVLTENKRKQQSTLPIVKIETECNNSPTAIITSESSKTALQTMTSMTGALVPDAALVTTLHYYPPAPALVQISQAEPTTTHCRSQVAKATSPVSCLTPPPEVPTTIEPSSFGVQDASNQTDAPDDADEQKQEPIVKQEQNLSPCQIAAQGSAAATQGANLTAANFEIVAPPPPPPPQPTERICNVVRITTTTTTVNPTVCGIVAKVDKAENTIINMADSAKYSAKEARSAIRTIEQDAAPRIDEEVLCGKENNKTPVCGKSRAGTRIIEITEENCDSFHENLEFFARRRDVGDRRDSYSKDKENVVRESNAPEKIEIESSRINASNIEVYHQGPKITEPSTFEEPKPSAADSTASCESCDKNRNIIIANGETRPQITVKSFDMPNIDADDQEMDHHHVVIKQEADDSCYDMCYESSHCEPTSTSERSGRPSHEKSAQETTKRHEKSHHPGIENVVEKLKKNAAAALQEAALPPTQKIDEKPISRRHYETIPKKLHFLRSCQNSMENGVDAEVSSSQQIVMSEQVQNRDRSGRYSPQTEDDRHSLGGSKCDTSGECLVSDNNNDSRSNNNNIKTFENKTLYEKNERNLCDVTAYVKPKTVWRCEVHLIEKNAARKLDEDALSEMTTKSARIQKQKPAIDVSGLELLSNSIEQLEQRIGQSEHSQMDVDEESPVKKNLIGQSQSENNNNNVGLGLLCALAEQIMEVGDKVPRKLNIDSSEEISQAGRLLLNLGRGHPSEKDGNKRKYLDSENHYSKRIKLDDEEVASSNYHEESIEDGDADDAVDEYQKNDLPQKEKNIKRVVDFSANEANDVSDERFVASEGFNSQQHKQRGAKTNETNDLQDNDARYNDVAEENNLSDSENETPKSKISFRQPVNGETEKRRTSVGEKDARDVHDCKNNTWTKSEAKKFAAKKGNRDNEDDWPNMNATELDMRVKMADIQRQYREKQKELSKLILPKKDEKKTPGRPRKKSHSSTCSDYGTLSSPPTLDLMSSPIQKSPPGSPGSPNGTSPPVISTLLPKCNVNLVKIGEPRSHIKLLDSIPSIPISVPLSSAVPSVVAKAVTEDEEKSARTSNYDTSSPAPTVNSTSASKKRKVGRPRKLTCTSGGVRHLTETIVAKKPKSKSSLVGYVLSSKNRHLQSKQYINNKTGYTPLPFKSGLSSAPKTQSKVQKVTKMKAKPAKQTSLHNKNVISSIIAEKAKLSQEVKLEKHSGNKIKPKLKAEVKIKNWKDDENDAASCASIPCSDEPAVQKPAKETPPAKSPEQQAEKDPAERSRHEKSKKKKRKSSSSQSPSRERKDSKRRKSLECKQCAKKAAAAAAARNESVVNRCKLTSAHLAIDQLRVLMAMGGLFYAGRLSAVQAPDVYAITLDGERGNRPHIHSREEILKDAIVEVCPSSTKELPPGTRLCAYWSQQYRCLYPGTSVEPLEPDPELDEKFVTVEFDDGDSGRISLDDIRLLHPNYPVVEYDPNPLLSLGKRRRQTSCSSEDKRSANSQMVVPKEGCNITSQSLIPTNTTFSTSYTPNVQQSPNNMQRAEVIDETNTCAIDSRKEKHNKKIKKKKLLETIDGKKKHRKRRLCKEHRKHKHKKHRKHKHRHHTDSSGDVGNVSNEESTMEQRNAEEMKEALQDASNSFSEEKTSSEESEELSEHVQEDDVQMDDDVQTDDRESSQFVCENVKENWTESEKSMEEDDREDATQKCVEDSRSTTTISEEAKDESEDIQDDNQTQSECQKSFKLAPRWVVLPPREEVQVNTENRGESLTRREKSSENIQENKNDQMKISSKNEDLSGGSSSSGNDYLADQSSSDSTNDQTFNTTFDHSSGTFSGSSSTNSSEEIQIQEDVKMQEKSSDLVQDHVQASTEIAKPSGTVVRVNEGTAETSSVSINQSTMDRGSNTSSNNTSETSSVPESNSKIASMLPDKLIWKWENPTRTSGANQYFASIRRGREMISVGDSVSFYCLYRNEKPYIGKIVKLWSNHKSQMKVKSNWFYRPEELDQPCKLTIP